MKEQAYELRFDKKYYLSIGFKVIKNKILQHYYQKGAA